MTLPFFKIFVHRIISLNDIFIPLSPNSRLKGIRCFGCGLKKTGVPGKSVVSVEENMRLMQQVGRM
jgi:hypothetical protein